MRVTGITGFGRRRRADRTLEQLLESREPEAFPSKREPARRFTLTLEDAWGQPAGASSVLPARVYQQPRTGIVDDTGEATPTRSETAA